MIITHLIGGLGNQLFQYAIAYDLSLRHNTKVILDISGFDSYKLHNYSLQHFNIPQNFYLTQRENFPSNLIDKFNQKRINPKKTIQIQESGYAFDKNYIDFPHNSHLYGYWQSEKYFMSISGLLLNKLEIKTPSSPENTILLDKMRGCESIGVHIRRCDYAPNSHTPDGEPALRGNYACIGYTYDKTNDVFYAPRPKDINGKPCESWTIDAPSWTWTPPIPYPTDGNLYGWNETTKSWVILTNI